ncbi:DUF1486 family protein [Natrialba magadii ATCC 43099]|uniref:DUF1486 family protein n=1 Tax=Natrialba magadii (strain ATCC 43099 / DSM 3394 / CCM 3739 / CIP 104546 / IAM 13178 / JCM 8861 / NBRC 102185 / NCIMB 2190 / MS3) TaxID=547559 RepID=D3SXC1_NATMM|nr:ester cyclase [Natrialba magadii]ADD03941.1 DUF1486 family protein [Natrialba magadii ATCC 43099]ELY33604.1 hypothetical protein C500_02190 [Natrialba magadii ATCC 43099]
MAVDASTAPSAVVRREIETVWNDDNLDMIDDLVTDEFTYHNPMIDESIHGPADYRTLVENFRGAVPDYEMTVEEMISDGEIVATRFRATGTQERPLLDIEPTGAKIDITGMLFDRIENGKLVERRVNDDAFGLLRQLGVVERQPF